ncbi:hypothetical protein [Ensifer sp. 22564]|uniref:hypothetical protein n=1 Tax=Ensifer sp. 22564 TaxID=3453943 RepID=UPI003F87D378
MSGEAASIVFFLVLAGIGIAWGLAQSSSEQRQKDEQESERKATIRRKYEGSPYFNDLMGGLIRQGMTGDMVIDSWGRPVAVDRKVYKTKVKEVWKYGPGPRRSFANKVTFENGLVVGWENR